MTMRCKGAVTAAIAVALISAAAAAAPATSPAKVRSGPSIKWPVVPVIPAGATVNKGGCIADWQTTWRQTIYIGVVSYAMESLLERQGALFPM